MTTLPAMKEDGVNAFLEQHGGPVGEFIKFSKDAKFERISDGEEIKVGTKLICVFPETQHGWVKFNGAGQPPTRYMGGMFNGYVPPPRGELGDDDPTLWEVGLSGKPQDPWKAQVLLPLKEVDGDQLDHGAARRRQLNFGMQANGQTRTRRLSHYRVGRRRIRA